MISTETDVLLQPEHIKEIDGFFVTLRPDVGHYLDTLPTTVIWTLTAEDVETDHGEDIPDWPVIAFREAADAAAFRQRFAIPD